MKFKFEKDIRIVNDLLTYCHRLGGSDYQANIHTGSDVTVFEVRCPIKSMSEAEIKSISESLNVPRQHEIEQNYWGLIGDAESQSDLMLTGMMVDEADVRYEQGTLCIVVKRLES